MKPWSQDWLIAAEAYPGFCSMKRVGVYLHYIACILHNILRETQDLHVIGRDSFTT